MLEQNGLDYGSKGLDGGLMKNSSSICDGLTSLVRNKVYRSLMVMDIVLVVLID